MWEKNYCAFYRDWIRNIRYIISSYIRIHLFSNVGIHSLELTPVPGIWSARYEKFPTMCLTCKGTFQPPKQWNHPELDSHIRLRHGYPCIFTANPMPFLVPSPLSLFYYWDPISIYISIFSILDHRAREFIYWRHHLVLQALTPMILGGEIRACFSQEMMPPPPRHYSLPQSLPPTEMIGDHYNFLMKRKLRPSLSSPLT